MREQPYDQPDGHEHTVVQDQMDDRLPVYGRDVAFDRLVTGDEHVGIEGLIRTTLGVERGHGVDGGIVDPAFPLAHATHCESGFHLLRRAVESQYPTERSHARVVGMGCLQFLEHIHRFEPVP